MLCQGVAAAHHHRLMRPIVVLLWTRLQRAAVRFATLAARLDAGTLKPPRPRRHPPADRTDAPERRQAPRPRLPSGHAWLLRRLPQAAAAAGSQLQHLLAQPDMQDMLRQAPQAGRILRPLCRMLGIQPLPPLLRLPERAPRRGAEPPGAAPPTAARTRPLRPRGRRPPREPRLLYIPGVRPILPD